MAFDLEKALENIQSEAKQEFGEDWPKVSGVMNDVINEEKPALREIAQAHVKGEITDDELAEQLEYEKQAFITGLSSASAVKKATIQRVASAMTALFIKVLKAV